MCRLFGFRSVIPSQVHNSLIEAENALVNQSRIHSDGWGLAYYVADAPHIVKSVSAAVEDALFKKVSGILASETVVAHIRKATIGSTECLTNVHPFQYGHWVFVHNGNIENFEQVKPRLMAEIPLKLRRFILGETDSELLFFLILGKLSQFVDLNRVKVRLEDVAMAVKQALTLISELVGPVYTDPKGPPHKTYLTFILSNGSTMLAHQGGKSLYYSSYKRRCSERDTCPSFSAVCENPSSDGYVNHLLFSSEVVKGENVWLEMHPGDMIGIDHSMRFVPYSNKLLTV